MGQKRVDSPPTWKSAITRAAFGAIIFFILIALIFKQAIGPALGFSAFVFLMYIPLGHAIDGFMYRRRLAAKRREAEERKARS
jgi:hypothetical protein